MICRGSANTATVGNEIARIWPLRSVIIARCPSDVVSGGFGAVNSAWIGLSGRCGASGCRMVASASLPITARNNRPKPNAVYTRRLARLLQCAAPLQVRLRDAHRLHARHGVRARGADALGRRAARRGIRGAERRSWPSRLRALDDPLRGADRHRPRRRKRGAPRHPERGTGHRRRRRRGRGAGSVGRGARRPTTGREATGVGAHRLSLGDDRSGAAAGARDGTGRRCATRYSAHGGGASAEAAEWGAAPPAAIASATAPSAASAGGGSGARTAGNRPSRSAMLVNWLGVTVFKLRN